MGVKELRVKEWVFLTQRRRGAKCAEGQILGRKCRIAFDDYANGVGMSSAMFAD